MVSLTRAGVWHVYEIKLNAHDWSREMKKTRLHRTLNAAQRTKRGHGGNWPSYWWLVTPVSMALLSPTLPSYAGHILVLPDGRVSVHQDAPNLNGRLLTKEDRENLYRSMYFRYWTQRRRQVVHPTQMRYNLGIVKLEKKR